MQNFFSISPPSEDYVQYSIYFPGQDRDATYLQQQATLISSFVLPYTHNYIWQRDAFGLVVVTNPQDLSYPYLKGRTRFGDALEDEWFIVFLLREISKQWSDVVISVSDCDGEFLLIEAANELPQWLQPHNSTNRVYIRQGNLHIIPKPTTEQERKLFPSGKVSIEKAVDLVTSQFNLTIAPENIQKAVFSRINGYPSQAKENIHHARVIIPRTLASILIRHPQLVAAAVQAFYMRDPIAMKSIYRMDRFPPSDSVECTIPFTRTLYAQLVAQRFHAPKPFKMPSVSDSMEFKKAELGMKLACGMEMLAAEKPSPFSSLHENPNLDTYDFERDDKFMTFIERLTLLGYFKGELKGSNQYNQLHVLAKEQYFRDKFADSEGDEQEAVHPSAQINRLLSLPILTDDELQPLISKVPDSDAWMDMSATDLEAAFAARRAPVNDSDEENTSEEGKDNATVGNGYYSRGIYSDSLEDDDDDDWEDQEDDEHVDEGDVLKRIKGDDLNNLSNMVKQLEIFMKGESGPDGIELPNYGEEEEEDDNEDDLDEMEFFRQVSVDPDGFVHEIGRVFDMPVDQLFDQSHNGLSARAGPIITEIHSDDEETLIPPDFSGGPMPPQPPNIKSFTTYASTARPNGQDMTQIGRDTDDDQQFSDVDENDMEGYMNAMDFELYRSNGNSKIGAGFERVPSDKLKNVGVLNDFDDDEAGHEMDNQYSDEEYAPIDMDVNLLKNMLESFTAQEGLPGPASTLLNSLGVTMPRTHTPAFSECINVDEVVGKGSRNKHKRPTTNASKKRVRGGHQKGKSR